jgi:drug/metabolite transporter (DMT)-like permease
VGGAALLVAGLTGVISLRSSTAEADFNGHHTSWIVPVLGLSLVAAAVAYAAGIGAARRLGARLASFIGLTEVLAAVIFAWLLLGQRPSLLQGVGGVVVLAGIALVRADEPEAAHEPEPALESVG